MKMDCVTLLDCICSNDFELQMYGKSGLEILCGSQNAEIIVESLLCGAHSKPDWLQDVTQEVWEQLLHRQKEHRMGICAIKNLFASENPELKRKSKEQLVNSYSKYIYSIIRTNFPTYAPKYMDDMFQCGVIGIMNAFQTHDDTHAFTTYARFFILHELYDFTRFVNHTSSVHYLQVEQNIKKACQQLETMQVQITAERVSELTGYSLNIVNRELRVLESEDMVSFHLIDSDTISDEPLPEEEAVKHLECSRLIECLKRLNEYSREIIYMRFVEEYTFPKIAEKLGKTKNEVLWNYRKSLQELKRMMM